MMVAPGGDSRAVTTTVDKYGHTSHGYSVGNSINSHLIQSFVYAGNYPTIQKSDD
jgi:hypothetical protein